MSFLRLARIFLPVSLLLMAASVVMLITPGLRLGIEFTGGTLMEFSLPEGKDRDALIAALDSFENENVSLESATVSKTKTDSYFVRTESLTHEEHLALAAHIQTSLGEVKELQFTTIGRASCGGRGEKSGVAGSFKKN